jgi:hypothetical protein
VPCTGTRPASISHDKFSGPAQKVEGSPPSRASEQTMPPVEVDPILWTKKRRN